MGNVNALGGPGNNASDLTVGTTAELNINNLALAVGSLSGGGIVTSSGATAGIVFSTGNGSNANNTTFSGSLVAATPADLAFTKTGTNNETLSGQSYYTGATLAVSGRHADPEERSTVSNPSSTAAQTPTLSDTAITGGQRQLRTPDSAPPPRPSPPRARSRWPTVFFLAAC